MADDLHLSSNEYSLALVVFFISYIVFEVPSNLILAKTRPSLYLPAIMVLWGIVTCAMSAVHSPQALYVVRLFLGILEAGFAPGVMLILSSWYKPDEQARRFSIFYSAAVLSGAFGGVVAGAITSSLHGAHGIAGWRWLFVRRHPFSVVQKTNDCYQIVEGAATIACAIIAVFILPDYPATTRRFSPRERKMAVERLFVANLVTYTEDSEHLSPFEAFKASAMNWRTWILTIGYMVCEPRFSLLPIVLT